MCLTLSRHTLSSACATFFRLPKGKQKNTAIFNSINLNLCAAAYPFKGVEDMIKKTKTFKGYTKFTPQKLSASFSSAKLGMESIFSHFPSPKKFNIPRPSNPIPAKNITKTAEKYNAISQKLSTSLFSTKSRIQGIFSRFSSPKELDISGPLNLMSDQQIEELAETYKSDKKLPIPSYKDIDQDDQGPICLRGHIRFTKIQNHINGFIALKKQLSYISDPTTREQYRSFITRHVEAKTPEINLSTFTALREPLDLSYWPHFKKVTYGYPITQVNAALVPAECVVDYILFALPAIEKTSIQDEEEFKAFFPIPKRFSTESTNSSASTLVENPSRPTSPFVELPIASFFQKDKVSNKRRNSDAESINSGSTLVSNTSTQVASPILPATSSPQPSRPNDKPLPSLPQYVSWGRGVGINLLRKGILDGMRTRKEDSKAKAAHPESVSESAY